MERCALLILYLFEPYKKSCPCWARFHLNSGIMSRGDTVTNRQPQSGAILFGGEERGAYFLQYIRLYTITIILYRQNHLIIFHGSPDNNFTALLH